MYLQGKGKKVNLPRKGWIFQEGRSPSHWRSGEAAAPQTKLCPIFWEELFGRCGLLGAQTGFSGASCVTGCFVSQADYDSVDWEVLLCCVSSRRRCLSACSGPPSSSTDFSLTCPSLSSSFSWSLSSWRSPCAPTGVRVRRDDMSECEFSRCLFLFSIFVIASRQVLSLWLGACPSRSRCASAGGVRDPGGADEQSRMVDEAGPEVGLVQGRFGP